MVELVASGVPLFLACSLLVGCMLEFVIKRKKLHVPYTAVLLVAGCIAMFFARQWDSGSLSESIEEASTFNPHVMLHIFLPALLFESAFAVNYHIMYRCIAQALWLAGPGVVFSAFLTALIPRYLMDYDWNWGTCLMFGSILSATDPVAVVALLREIGASKKLATLIEAESLLNDGVAYVMFLIFVEIAAGKPAQADESIGLFARLALGGPAWGLLCSVPVMWWMRHIHNQPTVEISLTFATAFFTFYVGEATQLHVSGVLAVVFSGLYFARRRTNISVEVEEAMHHAWHFVSHVANTMIFVISGILVYRLVFMTDIVRGKDYFYVLMLYVLLHVVRAIMVSLSFPFLKSWGYGMSWHNSMVLTWGALRGAVALVLALLVQEREDLEEETRVRVGFHVAGLVLLMLVINGSTTRHLLERLGLTKIYESESVLIATAVHHLEDEAALALQAIKAHPFYSGANWKAVENAIPKLDDFLSDKMLNDFDDTGHLVAVMRSESRHDLSGIMAMDEEIKDEEQVPMPPGLLQRPKTLGLVQPTRMMFLMYEMRRRMIRGMRSAYRHLFEQGMVSAQSVAILIEATEIADDNSSIVDVWAEVEAHLAQPLWLHALQSTCNFVANSKWTRHLIYQHLVFAVDILAAFVEALKVSQDSLSRQFDEDREVVCLERVKQETAECADAAHKAWVDIQNVYPEVYVAIQSRHAVSYVLHFQEKAVKKLHRSGILSEKEADEVTQRIEDGINGLHDSSAFLQETPTNLDLLLNISFLQSLRPECLHKVLGCREKIFDKGHKFTTAKERQNRGLLIITRGVASYKVGGNIVESRSVGQLCNPLAFFGIQLSGQADVEVESIALHAFEIKRSVVELIMRNEVSEGELWKSVGECLLKMENALRKHPSLVTLKSTNDVHEMCIQANYVRMAYPGTGFVVSSPTLLMTGAVQIMELTPDEMHAYMERQRASENETQQDREARLALNAVKQWKRSVKHSHVPILHGPMMLEANTFVVFPVECRLLVLDPQAVGQQRQQDPVRPMATATARDYHQHRTRRARALSSRRSSLDSNHSNPDSPVFRRNRSWSQGSANGANGLYRARSAGAFDPTSSPVFIRQNSSNPNIIAHSPRHRAASIVMSPNASRRPSACSPADMVEMALTDSYYDDGKSSRHGHDQEYDDDSGPDYYAADGSEAPLINVFPAPHRRIVSRGSQARVSIIHPTHSASRSTRDSTPTTGESSGNSAPPEAATSPRAADAAATSGTPLRPVPELSKAKKPRRPHAT